MATDDIQAAIRRLPRSADTLRALLISVECYAADLYRITKDADIGAVSDTLTDAFAAFDEATQPLAPLTREEWRDEQAGIDAYREAA